MLIWVLTCNPLTVIDEAEKVLWLVEWNDTELAVDKVSSLFWK